jgi:hypothetical protein
MPKHLRWWLGAESDINSHYLWYEYHVFIVVQA